ncbi:MAG: VOC family protein [Candidatus Delongbacteria bacterium]|nr:VOC family protein [Candidatus Delongbacteria bacterium]MBN2833671.1 VOC family protein [Candidatus Delongbacteria bacterium]
MKFYSGEINIICKDIEETKMFYIEIFGFKQVDEEEGAVRLENDGMYYLLLPFAENDMLVEKYCSKPEITFDLLVENLKETYDYLTKNNVIIEGEWNEKNGNIVVRDPNGLRIEIIEVDLSEE